MLENRNMEGENAVAVFEPSASRCDELETISSDADVPAAFRNARDHDYLCNLAVADCLSPADPRAARYERRCLQTSLSWNLRAERSKKKNLHRSVSDCSPGDRKQSQIRSVTVTDEDLDELKGTIDLGFGFTEQCIRNPALHKTLPALEFCSAIEHIKETTLSPSRSPTRSSSNSECQRGNHPSSPLVGECNCSSSPMREEAEGDHPVSTWTPPKPGDNPQSVKRQLRHWAQAVACITRIREVLSSA